MGLFQVVLGHLTLATALVTLVDHSNHRVGERNANGFLQRGKAGHRDQMDIGKQISLVRVGGNATIKVARRLRPNKRTQAPRVLRQHRHRQRCLGGRVSVSAYRFLLSRTRHIEA